MKLIGYMLGACLLLALLRAAALAIFLLIVGGFIVAAITRPRETVGLVALLLVAGLVQDHGLAFIVLGAIVAVVAAVTTCWPT